ncbi:MULTISPECIES: hypothetical protein [Campylobacter]|nr:MULTISPECIES: hypothetical protein [Campylobacter]MDU6828083.1 hypothetical protein [Campylobacter sp.]
MIGHTLHFSFNEIMELDVDEYRKFLEISKEILKVSLQSGIR